MLYLYFDKVNRILYASKHLNHLAMSIETMKQKCAYWTDIETVTADKDRGQIIVHSKPGGAGIVAEFPLGRTSLTCQKPE